HHARQPTARTPSRDSSVDLGGRQIPNVKLATTGATAGDACVPLDATADVHVDRDVCAEPRAPEVEQEHRWRSAASTSHATPALIRLPPRVGTARRPWLKGQERAHVGSTETSTTNPLRPPSETA